jgi:hypothetical protein
MSLLQKELYKNSPRFLEKKKEKVDATLSIPAFSKSTPHPYSIRERGGAQVG